MIRAALIGNPNVGKTTLFNKLTGSKEYVGNWAGVTVDGKEGHLGDNVIITDLPGIYALDTYSNEEKVSKDFLLKGNVDVIINIVDGTNLARNLFLTTQLYDFNIPIILAVNMADILEKRNIKINFEKLGRLLNVKVIPISAAKGEGIHKIKEELLSSNFLSHVVDNDYHFRNEQEAYNFINKTVNSCMESKDKVKVSSTEKIDSILLNKYLAYPIFFLIMFLMFKFTFSIAGVPLSDLLRSGLDDYLIPYLDKLLSSQNDFLRSLIVHGIVNGIGSVLVFIPVILALFLCISFLEDSGYMARAAFIMDRLMRKTGLSGKAFIPLIIGFGCSVPGIMSARTLESEKDRKLTALLVPLMSCNARLPVYVLFCSIFFKGHETTAILSLYLLGIVTAFLIGILFKNTLFKNQEEPFLIELPEYKMPQLKDLLLHTLDKGKGFIKKAGTIIFAASVVMWFLSNFNFNGTSNIENSFLAAIGKFIAPVFKINGFGNWKTAVALLAGLMAKEVIVSSMGVLYGTNLPSILGHVFTPASAYAFLVFILLYTPCISVIATMKKEFGRKMATFSVIYQLLVAYGFSAIVYNILKVVWR